MDSASFEAPTLVELNSYIRQFLLEHQVSRVELSVVPTPSGYGAILIYQE